MGPHVCVVARGVRQRLWRLRLLHVLSATGFTFRARSRRSTGSRLRCPVVFLVVLPGGQASSVPLVVVSSLSVPDTQEFMAHTRPYPARCASCFRATLPTLQSPQNTTSLVPQGFTKYRVTHHAECRTSNGMKRWSLRIARWNRLSRYGCPSGLRLLDWSSRFRFDRMAQAKRIHVML